MLFTNKMSFVITILIEQDTRLLQDEALRNDKL